MVPVPQVASWEALNVFLLEASRNDEQRLIGEQAQTVGAGMESGARTPAGTGGRRF